MKFALRNLPGASTSAPAATFDSLEDARVALRDALGWPEVQLGPGYTAPNTTGQVWFAYRTRAEAEADRNGLSHPRIVRINTDPHTSND
ncbi:MAG TPA: hypothetical protein VFK05_02900 [Polyangiaceae bacterium]|nr:hypothetical protein [Polyangiaceae bacterium]